MYKGKTILALIPARGGSKRIPGKNIKRLGTRPLIAWTIKACKSSRFIDTICVSSDDDKILRISGSEGSDILIKRPRSLARDSSPRSACILHAMEYFCKNKNERDYIILVQPTSPFRTALHIDAAIEALLDNPKADSLASFRRVSVNPSWLFTRDRSGFTEKIFKRGDFGNKWKKMPLLWEYNGAIFIGKWNDVKKKGDFESSRILLFEMDKYSSVDIDTEEDWRYAEILLKERQK